MPLSLVLNLRATATGAFHGDPARAAQALLLKWVAQRDRALAKRLHDGHGPRPYTASRLVPNFTHRGRLEGVEASRSYWLRFTSLTEELTAQLMAIGEELPGNSVELAGTHLTIEEVISDTSAHPWAGRCTNGELEKEHMLAEPKPSPRTTLRFVSPTSFRHTTEAKQQVNVPLPVPELVFGSLVDRWNAFNRVTLPSEVRRFAKECLVISRHCIRTEVLTFGAAKAVGFVGRCSYAVIVKDPYWLRVISLLSAYAFYCGVGQRTTVGMGQTREVK